MLKNRINSFRIIKIYAIYFLYILTSSGFSQSLEKQTIRVEKLEYNYYPSVKEEANYYLNSRVVFANDSILAKKMKQSVVSNINKRWNANVLDFQWDLNEIEPSYKTPKFKTELKQGIPGNWHLFFQVTDSGPYPFMDKKKNMFSLIFGSSPFFENLDYAPYYMRFKALIIDGSSGTEIFSNEMTFEMQRDAVPIGQILLRKVPSIPDSFLQAFDSAVQNFFSITPQKDLKLKLIPACLYLDVYKKLPNMKKLNFVTMNDTVIEELRFKQKWNIQNSNTKKIKRVNNWGNNITNGAINVFLGLPTDQITAKIYKTKFQFLNVNENKHYSCEIHFTEEKRVESDWRVGSLVISPGGSETTKRIIDASKKNYILCEKDTIGSFKISLDNNQFYKNQIAQFWDGNNESSIKTMSELWFNSNSVQNRYTNCPFVLEGEINNESFVIESSKAGNQIDIAINGFEIATLQIYNNLPVLGLLYSQPTDEKLFCLLMMFSSLPFNSIL